MFLKSFYVLRLPFVLYTLRDLEYVLFYHCFEHLVILFLVAYLCHVFAIFSISLPILSLKLSVLLVAIFVLLTTCKRSLRYFLSSSESLGMVMIVFLMVTSAMPMHTMGGV